MVASPSALIVAHPGHELLLHHWLEIARPVVFAITDGSGSGRSRIRSTIDVLEATGATAGGILAPFTDAEIYRLMLCGEVDTVVEMTMALSDALIDRGVASFVADAFELYNPTHDLCSVVASLAVERVRLIGGRNIARYEYAVTQPPAAGGEAIDLDEDAVARKLAAARRYDDLKLEVENAIGRIGAEAVRREALRPVSTVVDLPKLASMPFYERHGEKRVATGRYRTVIRYEQHFRPFVERLAAALNAVPVTCR